MSAVTHELDRERRLDDLIAAYLEQLEAGRDVSPDDWVSRFPEFRAGLLKFFTQRARVERLAAPLRALTQTPTVDPSRRLGDYQLIEEIGRSGMGMVYEAEQISLRRRVAVKVLPFAAMLDPRQLQRFKNEAQAASSLEHPHIVNVFFVGCERGVHFYAMRYVDGHSLAEVIDALREPQALAALQPIEPRALSAVEFPEPRTLAANERIDIGQPAARACGSLSSNALAPAAHAPRHLTLTHSLSRQLQLSGHAIADRIFRGSLGWESKRPMRSSTHIRWASSIGTSNLRICCWTATVISGSPISVSP
jgi:hypothetical protein